MTEPCNHLSVCTFIPFHTLQGWLTSRHGIWHCVILTSQKIWWSIPSFPSSYEDAGNSYSLCKASYYSFGLLFKKNKPKTHTSALPVSQRNPLLSLLHGDLSFCHWPRFVLAGCTANQNTDRPRFAAKIRLISKAAERGEQICNPPPEEERLGYRDAAWEAWGMVIGKRCGNPPSAQV